MINPLLKTHWTAEQIITIAEFLDQLQEVLWTSYRDELAEYYRWKEMKAEQGNEQQDDAETALVEDDDIPF